MNKPKEQETPVWPPGQIQDEIPCKSPTQYPEFRQVTLTHVDSIIYKKVYHCMETY